MHSEQAFAMFSWKQSLKNIHNSSFRIKNIIYWVTAWRPFDFILCDVFEVKVIQKTYLGLISFTYNEAKSYKYIF